MFGKEKILAHAPGRLNTLIYHRTWLSESISNHRMTFLTRNALSIHPIVQTFVSLWLQRQKCQRPVQNTTGGHTGVTSHVKTIPANSSRACYKLKERINSDWPDNRIMKKYYFATKRKLFKEHLPMLYFACLEKCYTILVAGTSNAEWAASAYVLWILSWKCQKLCTWNTTTCHIPWLPMYARNRIAGRTELHRQIFQQLCRDYR